MNKVVSITSVRRTIRNAYDHFELLKNTGLIDNLSEDDQRRFRALFDDIREVNSADWTTNYF